MLDINLLSPRPQDILSHLHDHQPRILGRGGYGMVYKAEYDNQQVAVKCSNAGMEMELQKEYNIIKDLKHSNVAQVFGFIAEPPCMVTELGAQGNLHDLLHDHQSPILTWHLRLSILIDVALGLQCLHSLPKPSSSSGALIHGDLSSSSVSVRRDWSVFLVDVGILKEQEQKEQKKTKTAETKDIDPPRWIAPEMLDYSPKITPAVDIYGFGLIMYEVLTRQLPYHEVQPTQLVRAIARGKKPTIPKSEEKCPAMKSAPIGYVGLMQKCWAQEPCKRPPLSDVITQLSEMMKPFAARVESESLKIFPSNVIPIIATYMVQLDPTPAHIYDLSKGRECYGLVSDHRHLYVMGQRQIDTSTLDGQCIKGSLHSLFFVPTLGWGSYALDISGKHLYAHNADKQQLVILTLDKKMVTSWSTQKESDGEGSRGIKVDRDLYVYITFGGQHEVFIYRRQGGMLRKTLGNAFSVGGRFIEGEFNYPAGLEIQGDWLYVCDMYNHRVQVVEKESGQYITHWGGNSVDGNDQLFSYPSEIHYAEGVVYVSDSLSIQVFTPSGLLLQRIKEKEKGEVVPGGVENNNNLLLYYNRGMWMVRNKLYVGDHDHQRIKVYSIDRGD